MNARGLIIVGQHTFSFYTTVGNYAPTFFIKFMLFWLTKQMPVKAMKCHIEISMQTLYI